MARIICTFDGACEPVNPGGAMGMGWTVNGVGRHEFAPESPENTNNVAEYMALEGLLNELLAGERIEEVVIFGDSKLVVSQLNGEYAVRSGNIYPHHQSVMAKLDELRSRGTKAVVSWHQRELNEQADMESKLALSENGVEPARNKPPEGFGNFGDIGKTCGKSAVKVGRCLTFLGYRDMSGRATDKALAGEAIADQRFDGFGLRTEWDIEKTAAIVAAAPPEAFASSPSSKQKKVKMVEVEGDTFPVREALKAMGGKWHPKKRCWTVPESKAEAARKAVAGKITDPR